VRLTTSGGGSSEDPLGLSVDLLEGGGSAFVEDVLGGEALIFIVVVCVHAVSELLDLVLAELVENGLAGGALILSGEATCKVGLGQIGRDSRLHIGQARDIINSEDTSMESTSLKQFP
jgi:hypothetical protein